MCHRSDVKNKTIITSFHKVDKLGKDRPGVGNYESGVDKTKFTRRNFSIGCNLFSKDKRFKSVTRPKPKVPNDHYNAYIR